MDTVGNGYRSSGEGVSTASSPAAEQARLRSAPGLGMEEVVPAYDDEGAAGDDRGGGNDTE